MARFVIDGDASGAVSAVQDLKKAQDENKAASVSSAKEMEKAFKIGERVIRATETAQERYNRKVKETAQLVKDHGLTQDKAEQAVKRYREQMERAGKSGQDAMGPKLTMAVLTANVAMQALSRTIGVAVKGYQDLQAEKQKAQADASTGTGGLGKLAQVSATEAEFKSNVNAALGFVGEGMLKDEGAAGDLVFDMISAGVKDRNLFRQLGHARFVKPEELSPFARGLGLFSNAFTSDSVGTERDVINKLVATASPTAAGAAEIAQAAAELGPLADMAKMTDEESLAALGIATGKFGTAAGGRTIVEAILGALDKQGVVGSTLAERLDVVKGDVSQEKSIRDLLGNNKEVIKGFAILSDTDRLRSETQRITQAAETDDLTQRLSYVYDDPVLGPQIAASQAAGRKHLADRKKFAAREALVQARRDDAIAGAREADGFGVEVGIAAFRAIETITPDSVLIREAAKGDFTASDLTKDQAAKYLQRTAEATEKAANGPAVTTRPE